MQRVVGEDRRIFHRIPAELSLRFREQNSNQWGLGQTQDISAQGIGLFCEKELSPRTSLEMWLPIPDRGESYYTLGEVVWSRRVDPDKYRMGISLAKTDLMGMSQVVRTLL